MKAFQNALVYVGGEGLKKTNLLFGERIVEIGGEIVAATGSEFAAYDLKQRRADVPRFSIQRSFTERYALDPSFDDWARQVDWQAVEAVALAEQPAKALLPRRVAYPDYRVHDAVEQGGGIYKFECNSSGFLGMRVKVEEPALLRVSFDELLGADGHVHIERLGCQAYVIYELAAGEYDLESFEPYTMQFAEYEPVPKNVADEIVSKAGGNA